MFQFQNIGQRKEKAGGRGETTERGRRAPSHPIQKKIRIRIIPVYLKTKRMAAREKRRSEEVVRLAKETEQWNANLLFIRTKVFKKKMNLLFFRK